MEGGVSPRGELDPQSGHQQREPKLDIPPLQTKIPSQIRGVLFESTFYKLMMTEIAFTKGPSIQPSYTELAFFKPAYSKPTYTKEPPPYALLTPAHAPWMDLSAQVSLVSTRMEELVVIKDICFYFMDDRMDQYQSSFPSQLEYLQQRINRIEDRMQRQHEDSSTTLIICYEPPCSFFMLLKGKIFQVLGGQDRCMLAYHPFAF